MFPRLSTVRNTVDVDVVDDEEGGAWRKVPTNGDDLLGRRLRSNDSRRWMLAERPKPDVDPGVAENVTVVTQASAPLPGVDASLPSTDPRRCTEATTLTAIVFGEDKDQNRRYWVLNLMATCNRLLIGAMATCRERIS